MSAEDDRLEYGFAGIHHASVLVADTERSLAFYRDLLGLELDTTRPELSFGGAWLNAGEGQQIHLLELPNPDPTRDRPAHGGRDRHTAFRVHGLDRIAAVLTDAGVPVTRSRSGRKAVFCRDPDGNTLELIESDPAQA